MNNQQGQSNDLNVTTPQNSGQGPNGPDYKSARIVVVFILLPAYVGLWQLVFWLLPLVAKTLVNTIW